MKKKILITVFTVASITAAVLGLSACKKPQEPAKYYTVNFETNGGTAVESLKLKKGETITEPSAPEKTFYTFDNWYSDAAFTQKYTFGGTMPAEDVTIYANWIGQTTFVISFDSKGGTAVENIANLSGTPLTAPEAPVREGYTFGGWYNGETEYSFTVMPSENVTLTAKWNEISSNRYLTYMLDGEVCAVDFVQAGRKAQEYEPEVSADLEVIGWFTDEACTQKFDFNASVTENKTLYAVTSSKGLQIENGVVTGYTGGENVVIPAAYGGNRVTAIANDAFLGNNGVVTVKLPATVTQIGERAFYNCAYLFDIDLKNVNAIGDYAFYGCLRLRHAGSMENLTEVKAGTFNGCSDLREAETSDKLTAVGDYAFADCAMLASVTLSDNVTAIGNYAFSGTPVTEFKLPQKLANLGEGAFAGCANLNTVTVAQGNTKFEVKADGLTEGATLIKFISDATEFTIPSYITKIAYGAFSENATVTDLTIGAGVECARGALKGMKALKTLTITALPANPVSGESYLSYLFGASDPIENGVSGNYMPETLTKITLTQSVTALPAYAFYGCNRITEISGLENVQTLGAYSLAYTGISSVALGNGFKSFENNDPQKVFYGAVNLKEITLGSGSSCGFSVYDNALYEGTVLKFVPAGKTTIEFKSGITSIGAGAFEFSSISEITLPATVTGLECGAFRRASDLSKLALPFIGGGSADTEYIPYIFGATYTEVEKDGETETEWTNEHLIPYTLKEIVITGNVTKIADYAFYNLRVLEGVTFSEGSVITEIGKYAYYSTAIEELPDLASVTAIGEAAFMLCTNLASVTIPGNVKTIADSAFNQLRSATEIIISEGVEEIGAYAFAAYQETYVSGNQYVYGYLSEVTNIEIPASVTKIGKCAFLHAGTNFRTADGGYDFTENFKIIFAQDGNLVEIGDEAFAYTAITELNLGAKLQKIGGMAFAHCELLETIQIGSLSGGSALTEIGGGAFSYNGELTALRIYKQVSSVEEVPAITPYTDEEEETHQLILEDSEDCVIYVPLASVQYYTAADVWSSVTQINDISAI